MSFAHQHLLWFLLIIPALVGMKVLVDGHASKAERLFTAVRLRPTLVMGRSLWRSWFVYALYIMAMACLVVAVAQPRWGEEKLEVPDKGRNIFIAIDTSRSMLARDVPPDRLTRARLAAHDLVMELNGERVGLLAFAGRAYLQAPLTTDHDAIIESLLAFDHTIIEWGGSNLADLLEVTLRAIKGLPKSNYALVIFSDGGDADANLVPYIQRLTAAGIVVVTVGVGTDTGTLIPNPEVEGDYIRDEAGNVVRSQLQSGVLQQLATATGGRFLKLDTRPLNRQSIQPVLDRLTEQESANRQTSRPIERFAWPLSLGIFLLMLAWIISALPRPAARPVVLALAVAAFAPAPPAQAAGAGGMLAALFATSGPTPDEALKALKAGDFKKARDLYGKLLEREDFDAHSREELLYGLATTEHDLTNYDGSVKNFSEVLHTEDKSLRARAHRGLGQTLYDQGVRGLQQQPKITLQRWTDALRHLDAAQDLDPENKELRENREHVDKMLAQLRQVMKQMEEKQGKKGDKGKKGQKGDKGQGQQGKEGDEGDAGQEGSDPNGEGEPKEQKEGKGEKKEADDGIGGKDAKELPEGRLQAAGNNPGEKEGQQGKEGEKPGGDDKKKAAKEGLSDQRNPRTGYTPGEAEGIIRQYMDEITAPLTNRYHTPPPNKKDW
ncbi:VWA domain-containing protein [Prosthecobacter sp.]|jgi:Ca-activated chloride channel family protein|uniref:VWA domain-containing protein n=1 Tax=Prosthecobacter sp. TaxID=1965333 RepID=UPI0037CBF3A3